LPGPFVAKCGQVDPRQWTFTFCTRRLQQPAEASRQMPVDENGLPVLAVACNIRHVVGMADLANPPSERFYDVQEDKIVNIFGFVAQFSLQVHCWSVIT